VIRASEIVSAAGPASITAVIVFTDDAGAGIRRVTVRDRAGVEIPVPQPMGCPAAHEAPLGAVSRDRLPLRAEAVDCSGAVTPPGEELFRRFATFPTPGIPGGCDESVECPAPPSGCGPALTRVIDARRPLEERCGACRALESQADAKMMEMIALAIAAVVFFLAMAAAFSAGGFWGAILGILFGIVSATLVGLSNAAAQEEARLRAEAIACRRGMEGLRAAFAAAAADVLTQCPCACQRPGISLEPPC
jgi:hypothetical protein